jgi:hypothetical protein
MASPTVYRYFLQNYQILGAAVPWWLQWPSEAGDWWWLLWPSEAADWWWPRSTVVASVLTSQRCCRPYDSYCTLSKLHRIVLIHITDPLLPKDGEGEHLKSLPLSRQFNKHLKYSKYSLSWQLQMLI